MAKDKRMVSLFLFRRTSLFLLRSSIFTSAFSSLLFLLLVVIVFVRELQNDIKGFEIPSHGHLSRWAEQGVLLLNACLTVRAATPNSHANKGMILCPF
jgi:hypothetical protein